MPGDRHSIFFREDEDEGEDEDTPAAPPASANRDGLLAPLSRLLDLTEHMQTLTLTLPRSLLRGSTMPTSTTTGSTGAAGSSAWPGAAHRALRCTHIYRSAGAQGSL